MKDRDDEHRSNRRVPISTAIRIRCENWDHFQTEYLGNLSGGGIFIATAKPLKPGTLFALELSVGGEKVQTKAQVIWTKEFSQDGRPSGMGARFLELDAQSHKVLTGWLEDLEKKA